MLCNELPCLPRIVVSLRIQLGASVEPCDLADHQEINVLLSAGANVRVVGELILALEGAIEVFAMVAISKESGACCQQRDNVIGIVLVVVKVGGRCHGEKEKRRTKRSNRDLLGF